MYVSDIYTCIYAKTDMGLELISPEAQVIAPVYELAKLHHCTRQHR